MPECRLFMLDALARFRHWSEGACLERTHGEHGITCTIQGGTHQLICMVLILEYLLVEPLIGRTQECVFFLVVALVFNMLDVIDNLLIRLGSRDIVGLFSGFVAYFLRLVL